MLALALDGAVIVFIALCPGSALLAAILLVTVTAGLETIVLGLHGAIGQTIVPAEMQGRVFALILSASQGLAPLGLLLAGPVADAFGVQFWWLLTGILILVVGSGALFVPEIMHIEDPAYQPVQGTESLAAD
jgi:DHA3 family macrolide efflux protein-like MFS transporter